VYECAPDPPFYGACATLLAAGYTRISCEGVTDVGIRVCVGVRVIVPGSPRHALTRVGCMASAARTRAGAGLRLIAALSGAPIP